MGDVAMLIPLLYAVARANEQHEFILLTQPFFTELLLDAPDNVEGMAIDIRREEKSFLGLLRYARRLRHEHFDAVLDLHDVLRTKVLRSILRLTGVPTQHLCKPRQERRRLIADSPTKDLTPLTPMWQLYQQVFRSAGLVVPEAIPPVAIHPTLLKTFERLHPELMQPISGRIRLGIAPFASTRAKTYDPDLMQEALRLIEDSQLFELFLFGSRGREQAQIKQWAADRPHVHSVAGQLDLSDELILIASLRAMISMDSANMHLASMVGTRVFSIWCCTHPAAGFLGIGQRFEDCLQPEDAPRRPCSIFGDNKHCHTGPDFACSRALSPERILQAVLTLTESAGS